MRKIRYWYLLTPVLLIVIFLFITNIEFISGRGDDVYTSINSRIKIIQHAVGNIQMFFTGNGFGLATSAAVISKIPNAVISDNTIVGIYYNAGIFGVITFALFIVYAYRNLNLLFFLTFLGFGLTTVILELNPVIQIIFIMFGSQIASRSKKNQEKRMYYIEPSSQLGPCGPLNKTGAFL